MAGTCAGSADAPGRPVLRAVVPWLGARESWLSTHGDSTTERPRVHLGAEDPWQRRQGPGSVTETSESPALPGRWPQGPFTSVCARGRTRDPRPRPEGLPRARPSARSGDASPPARPAPSLRSSCRWRHPGSSSTCAGTSQHLLQACRLRPRPPPPGWPRPQASHAPRPAHTPSRPARPQGYSAHPRGTLPAPRTAPLPAAGTPSGERFPGPQPLCVCGPGSPWGCVCLVGPWRWALAALSLPRAPSWGGPQGSKGSLCGGLDSPGHRRSWLCFGVRPAAQAPQ